MPRLFPLKKLVTYILAHHPTTGLLYLPVLLRLNFKSYLYIYRSR